VIKEIKKDLALRVCDICGQEQWVSYYNIKNKTTHICRYCSCRKTAKSRKGISWNRGKKLDPKVLGTSYINSGGYVCTWVGKHTLKDKAGGYYLEHRLQAELLHNRSLGDRERIHHIDGNKINNLPNNLYICNDDKHHRNIHSQLERIALELVKAKVISFNHEDGKYTLDPNVCECISKSLELLENPDNKDNQQRSFIDQSLEERSTTIQKWSTLKRVEAGDSYLLVG